MSNDPRKQCKICIWFSEKKDNPIRYEDPILKIGHCRRYAPTMNSYPVIFNNDWCGDHISKNKETTT